MLQRIDNYLFKRLYGLAVGNLRIGKITVLVTKLSSKVFYVIYLAFVLLLVWQRDMRIVPFLAGPAAALLLTGELRRVFCRPRPFVELGIESLVEHAADGSFPSKHAMSAFVIGMSVWYLSTWAGIFVLALAGLTGLSRVMVGVHFPSDILLGAVIGVLASVAAFNLL
ncbi:phosphatase PAP2 family protein [Dethiobacter alkaliphilus]|uniref:phosphatase PAP2 family protein n=1 Tax=Dethiobacter alkaliphilus TaxID=427926 RepID=UPI00222640CD|nr:phosphatase PAP2 family protein [Dethiobacter alkaliphilus]MCW3488798.1 phosphatase PAP2 family protein [Dethiobacter alkaliphilus]